MKVQIKRVDKDLPMPDYQTDGASAFDLYARVETVIEPNEISRIPSNLIIDVPTGFGLVLTSRSSLIKKKGLGFFQGVGLIDSDYNGPEDEIQIQVTNFTDQAVTVDRGERIAQAWFSEMPRIEWEEVDEDFKDNNRGGFGASDI